MKETTFARVFVCGTCTITSTSFAAGQGTTPTNYILQPPDTATSIHISQHWRIHTTETTNKHGQVKGGHGVYCKIIPITTFMANLDINLEYLQRHTSSMSVKNKKLMTSHTTHILHSRAHHETLTDYIEVHFKCIQFNRVKRLFCSCCLILSYKSYISIAQKLYT